MYSHKISPRGQLILGFVFLVFLPLVLAFFMWQAGDKVWSISQIFLASLIFSNHFIKETRGKKIQIACKLFTPVVCLILAFCNPPLTNDLALVCFCFALLSLIGAFVENKILKLSLAIPIIVLACWFAYKYLLQQ